MDVMLAIMGGGRRAVGGGRRVAVNIPGGPAKKQVGYVLPRAYMHTLAYVDNKLN